MARARLEDEVGTCPLRPLLNFSARGQPCPAPRPAAGRGGRAPGAWMPGVHRAPAGRCHPRSQPQDPPRHPGKSSVPRSLPEQSSWDIPRSVHPAEAKGVRQPNGAITPCSQFLSLSLTEEMTAPERLSLAWWGRREDSRCVWVAEGHAAGPPSPLHRLPTPDTGGGGAPPQPPRPRAWAGGSGPGGRRWWEGPLRPGCWVCLAGPQ